MLFTHQCFNSCLGMRTLLWNNLVGSNIFKFIIILFGSVILQIILRWLAIRLRHGIHANCTRWCSWGDFLFYMLLLKVSPGGNLQPVYHWKKMVGRLAMRFLWGQRLPLQAACPRIWARAPCIGMPSLSRLSYSLQFSVNVYFRSTSNSI